MACKLRKQLALLCQFAIFCLVFLGLGTAFMITEDLLVGIGAIGRMLSGLLFAVVVVTAMVALGIMFQGLGLMNNNDERVECDG